MTGVFDVVTRASVAVTGAFDVVTEACVVEIGSLVVVQSQVHPPTSASQKQFTRFRKTAQKCHEQYIKSDFGLF